MFIYFQNRCGYGGDPLRWFEPQGEGAGRLGVCSAGYGVRDLGEP